LGLVNIPIKLENLQIFGKLRLTFKPLYNKPPFFGGVAISLMDVVSSAYSPYVTNRMPDTWNILHM
jgi:Ca2+-dependent lipid-binding protein